MPKPFRRAFTLIELLIVVAIIAILAAIAVPNFLEAQTRARVSRVKNDMRTIATGLEAYAVDHNQYPHLAGYAIVHNQWNRGGILLAWSLTTPVRYLATTDVPDPFSLGAANEMGEIIQNQMSRTIHYTNIQLMIKIEHPTWEHWASWVLISLGPDYVKGPDPRDGGGWLIGDYADAREDPSGAKFGAWQYDATNGTVSSGDILRWP